jgi:hypothetical protein
MNPIIFCITPEDSLTSLVQAMKAVAQEEHAAQAPVYASTEEEAMDVELEEVIADGKTQFLHFTDYGYVSVVLSIDTFGTTPCWHLSMGRASPQDPPGRVADHIVKRLTKAFGILAEGSSEGAFRNVRHFRAAYQPD